MTGHDSPAVGGGGGDTPTVTRSLVAMLLFSALVRALVIALLPEAAVSIDFKAFSLISRIVGTGENPYVTTTILNWPPLLMQLFYLIGRAGAFVQLDFIDSLRIFLIVCESILIVLIRKLMVMVTPAVNWRTILMVGIVLNPIEILLVCQHGNLDLLVMIWVVAATISILRHEHTHQPISWLFACLFLGLGVLTKSYPALLAPVLVAGFRRMAWAERALGTILFIGPAAYGLSIIYVLDPPAVVKHVLLYGSIPGFFGITGIAHALGMATFYDVWGSIVSIAFLVALPFTAVTIWRRGLPADSSLILLVALTMLAVPTLGSGFGTQYIHWSLPFLIATYAAFGRHWRLSLLLALAVTVVTYLFIYALSSAHGAAIVHGATAPAITELSAWVSSRRGQTLSMVPMFITWLIVLGTGLRQALSVRPESA